MTITLVYGSTEHPGLPINGTTVAAARAQWAEAFNIPSDAKAFVNGNEVGEDFIVNDGARLEFRKPTGSKA